MNKYLLCLLMVILWACGGGQDFDTAEHIERNPQANKVLQQDLLELFLKARSFDAASPLAQKFYQTQKKQPDPCYYMGVILREKGVYEEAERYFLEGLTYDPKHARIYDALGILYGVQNKRVRSLKAHQKAVELDQTNPKFWHNLGFALSINKQLDQAVQAYQKALSLAPDSSRTFTSLAFVYAAQEKYQEAERYLSQVLSPAQVQYNFGLIFEKKQNFARARTHYEKALVLNASLKLAREALSRLDQEKELKTK